MRGKKGNKFRKGKERNKGRKRIRKNETGEGEKS